MATNSKRRQVVRSLGAVAVGWATGGWRMAGAQDRGQGELTLSLDFTALGRHTPWYVALGKGYFKQAGLNVKIVPGQGTAQAIQALESGIAQFAFSDVVSLALARARGASSAKFVAMNYQSAPYAVFSLAQGANVTKPEQLGGLEIASGAGSFSPKVIQGFMKQHRLDPGSVKFVNVDGAARVGMLLSKKVPSIENFIFTQVGLEKVLPDGQLSTLLLADHGLELYANGLLVKEDMIKSRPDTVRAFVKAAMQGWRDTMADPQAASEIMANYVPGINRDVVVGEIKLLSALAQSADTRRFGMGWIDAGRMQRSVDFIAQNIGIPGAPLSAASLFTTDFLPKGAA
ncbi:ABC transporter substrate-binding protein [Pandoraea sputorum]|uniref:ABC transporter substrate-binding protein n=1 Tax=Pandoraea sputorum TaxID=93222 RepID=UPI002F3F9955